MRRRRGAQPLAVAAQQQQQRLPQRGVADRVLLGEPVEQHAAEAAQLALRQLGHRLEQREAQREERRAHARRLCAAERPQRRQVRLEQRLELRGGRLRGHAIEQRRNRAQCSAHAALVLLGRLGRLVLVGALCGRRRERPLGERAHELLAAEEEHLAKLGGVREGRGKGSVRRAPHVVLRVALAAEPRRDQLLEPSRELPTDEPGERG